MNNIKLVFNKLSILRNTNCLAWSLTGIKHFSSLLGVSAVNNAIVNSYPKSLFKTNLNLTPASYELVQKCGLKIYGKPKLRCKFCYYAGIEGVLHVFCTKFPRHKQRAITSRKKKYDWILTHACQSKYRPY